MMYITGLSRYDVIIKQQHFTLTKSNEKINLYRLKYNKNILEVLLNEQLLLVANELNHSLLMQ